RPSTYEVRAQRRAHSLVRSLVVFGYRPAPPVTLNFRPDPNPIDPVTDPVPFLNSPIKTHRGRRFSKALGRKPKTKENRHENASKESCNTTDGNCDHHVRLVLSYRLGCRAKRPGQAIHQESDVSHLPSPG